MKTIFRCGNCDKPVFTIYDPHEYSVNRTYFLFCSRECVMEDAEKFMHSLIIDWQKQQ